MEANEEETGGNSLNSFGNNQLLHEYNQIDRIQEIQAEAELNCAIVGLSGLGMDTTDWEHLDIYLHHHSSTFDRVIGAIEDIIMSSDFQNLHKNQLEECYNYIANVNVHQFSTVLFQTFKEYSQSLAHYIENEIKKILPDFDLESFVAELQERNDIDRDIHELLSTMIDCKKFQEMVDDYKNMKEGRSIDLSSGITITKIIG